MNPILDIQSRPRCNTCRWRQRLAPSLVALALALPGGAHPCSLELLLRLPLERLLELEILPHSRLRAEASTVSVAAGPAEHEGRHAA